MFLIKYKKMLEPNFENQGGKINEKENKIPKIRLQYSGGFRCLAMRSPRKAQQKMKSVDSKQGEDQIMRYVREIDVENLSELFIQTIEDPTPLLKEKKKQQQQDSIMRLYQNQAGRKKNQQSKDKQQESAQKKQGKYANEIWGLDKKYQKAPLQYIIKKEILKVDSKMKVQWRNKLKKDKVDNHIFTYNKSMAAFILIQKENLMKKKMNEKDDQYIYFSWKQFLASNNLNRVIGKAQKQKLSSKQLEQLYCSYKYLYCLFGFKLDKSKQKGQQLFTIESLMNLLATFEKLDDVPTQLLKQKFLLQKNYTNPYQIQYRNKVTSVRKVQNVQEQHQQKFKAKPPPKTTYEIKRDNQQKQVKTTKIQPFNLTETANKIVTPEQYYNFQKMRHFKPLEVPETTYKPFQPELLSQEQKRARAKMELSKAKYPKTMRPPSFKDKEQNQPQNTKINNQKKIEISPVPDFHHLHARQIVSLQQRKERNKKQIQLKPFNLSVTKRLATMEQDNRNIPQIHPYIPIPYPDVAVKSTKKFEAYIQYRNQEKEQREKQNKEKQKQLDKKKNEKEPYRQIIKERMIQQFESHPQKKNPYDSSLPKRIKVDKEKIYRERPLLMESKLPRQQYQLGWDPIF